MDTLYALYRAHTGKVSDKWESYLHCYQDLLGGWQDKEISLLEIGVQNGGSLEIWSQYFPRAKALIGCDINPDCVKLSYADPRISVVVGDACSEESARAVRAIQPSFDIVIDDGSHRSSDIIKAFALYFPNLHDGGLFIAEDLHCSYWREFEGGLFDQLSSISFFKRLADVINFEHWGIDATRASILAEFAAKYGVTISEEILTQIHSVTFVNSICIVKKRSLVNNLLGMRTVAGTVEAVVPGHLPLAGGTNRPLKQNAGPAPKDPILVERRLHEIEAALQKGRS